MRLGDSGLGVDEIEDVCDGVIVDVLMMSCFD